MPVLTIPGGTFDVDFYKNAFGAIEARRFSNDDGSIHVSELVIDGAMFHLHEENLQRGSFSPAIHNGITAVMGLEVDNVDEWFDRAIAAGAKEISRPQNYDYGLRQADLVDPIGHRWTLQSFIHA